MMKKTLLATICLAVILIFSSCRKGENDPFMSLKTRDARITGQWEMTFLHAESYALQKMDTMEYEFEIISDFEDGVYTQKFDEEIQTFDYLFQWTINKDGTIESYQEADSTTTKAKGDWWWLDQVKNKAGIVLGGRNYKIDRLTNKELVLTGDYYYDFIDPEFYDFKNTLNFIMKFEKIN